MFFIYKFIKIIFNFKKIIFKINIFKQYKIKKIKKKLNLF